MRRIVSGILFTLLLAGMVTLAFNIQLGMGEPEIWIGNGDGSAGFSQLPLGSGGRWDFGNESELGDFAFVDDDSAELVIGLDDTRPNSYSQLVDLIVNNGGELVNTVLMDGTVRAVVADMPHETTSTFVSEVEAAGLSRYVESNVSFEVDFVPNDLNWTEQWGLGRIEAEYAWNTTMGDPSVLVAVIDTGVDWDHPDLAANYVPLGYDWVNNDTDPMDDHGHGTHCAGVIGAVINNSIGVAGLAQVRIMAEKGLGPTGGSSDDLANAIVHAVDQGADILSNSWGSYFRSTVIQEAVEYAHDQGVLVIASAGNDATECSHYPSGYEEVVAVTATNESDNPAYFTNFGDQTEIAAPGVNVFSTLWDDTYESLSGTSMSAPHVAGVAALIWSQFPNMTRDQVRVQLRSTADDLGDLGFDEYYGYGRVNARRAVEQTLPEHDLVLLYWKASSLLKPSDTVTINSTLLNFGANNESDITVQLLINSSIAESVFVSHLASGASTTISFTWSSTVEGKYNVTLYVEHLHDEMSTENNVLSKFVVVKLSEVILVPDDFSTIQKALNEVSSGYTVRANPGMYYEHIVIAGKSVTLMGENQQTTIIDGNGVERVVWELVADNVNVTGFTIQNGWYGVYLTGSTNSNVSGNNVTSNIYGIFLLGSDSNTIDENNVTNMGWDCISLYFSDGNSITSNTVTDSFSGIYAFASTNNSIVKNKSLRNTFGVCLDYSGNNVVNGNEMSGDTVGFAGIVLTQARSNVIERNLVSSFTFYVGVGIYLEWFSDNNTIIQNTLTHNQYGINLGGFTAGYCYDNVVCHNNFINNMWQGFSKDSISTWDDGYPSGGNYWSDYAGVDSDGDGIGDTSYVIDATNEDRFPLMNPWGTGTPVAGYTWTPSIATAGESETFDASSSLPIGGEILSYEWDFGDDHYDSGEIVTHTYTSSGIYTVTLNITDTEGLWDIEQKQVQVVQPHGPTAEFVAVPDPAFAMQSVKFDASTSLPGWNGTHVMPIVEYRWNFSDGTSKTTNTPITYHKFQDTGNYDVTLTVHAPGATPETDSTTHKVTIAALPIGGYSFPIKRNTSNEPFPAYVALLAMLTTALVVIKRKEHSKHA